MIAKLLAILGTLMVVFGMSLLIVPGVGIIFGVIKKLLIG
jgi:hypothetical protein